MGFSVKSIGDNRIGGYGIVFTDREQPERDLDGEYFTKTTNLWLDQYPEVPLLYHHGMDEQLGLSVIGTAKAKRIDEDGAWYEAQLNMRSKYKELVERLIADGALGFSTGSVQHLVRKTADGELVSWPVVEMTLTPTPAAGPYLTTVSQVKSSCKSAGLDLAIDEPEASEEDEDAQENTQIKQEEKMKKNKKNEALEQEPRESAGAEAPKNTVKKVDDIDLRVKSLVDAQVKELLRPVTKSAKPAQKHEDKAEEATKAFNNFLHGAKSVKALERGTDSEGGYTVPEQFVNDIVVPLNELSVMRRAGARIINMTSDTLKLPVLGDGDAAELIDEEAAYTAGDPSFSIVTFTPYKLQKKTLVSEELYADSAFDIWGEILAPDAAQAFASAENTHFTTGTGSSQPQGVVTGAGVGKTADAVDAITADELIDLFYSLNHMYRRDAVWMMNDSIAKYIRKLQDSTSGEYLWERSLANGQPPTLLGRPVIINNSMASTIEASAKTVLIGNMNYFAIGVRSGISTSINPYINMDNGQITYYTRERVDSHVLLAEAFKVLQQAAS